MWTSADETLHIGPDKSQSFAVNTLNQGDKYQLRDCRMHGDTHLASLTHPHPRDDYAEILEHTDTNPFIEIRFDGDHGQPEKKKRKRK